MDFPEKPATTGTNRQYGNMLNERPVKAKKKKKKSAWMEMAMKNESGGY